VCVGGGKEEYFGFVVEYILYLFGSFFSWFCGFRFCIFVFLFEFFFLADTGAFFERFLVRSHLWICVCGYFSFFFRGNLV